MNLVLIFIAEKYMRFRKAQVVYVFDLRDSLSFKMKNVRWQLEATEVASFLLQICYFTNSIDLEILLNPLTDYAIIVRVTFIITLTWFQFIFVFIPLFNMVNARSIDVMRA